MYAHVNGLQGQSGHGEDGRGQAGSPGVDGLVGLFCSVPFRQLAGPAAVFFLWPPVRARKAFPGRQPGMHRARFDACIVAVDGDPIADPGGVALHPGG